MVVTVIAVIRNSSVQNIRTSKETSGKGQGHWVSKNKWFQQDKIICDCSEGVTVRKYSFTAPPSTPKSVAILDTTGSDAVAIVQA
jgi:hypothetical protein